MFVENGEKSEKTICLVFLVLSCNVFAQLEDVSVIFGNAPKES
jgi:hypothetical protein